MKLRTTFSKRFNGRIIHLEVSLFRRNLSPQMPGYFREEECRKAACYYWFNGRLWTQMVCCIEGKEGVVKLRAV